MHQYGKGIKKPYQLKYLQKNGVVWARQGFEWSVNYPKFETGWLRWLPKLQPPTLFFATTSPCFLRYHRTVYCYYYCCNHTVCFSDAHITTLITLNNMPIVADQGYFSRIGKAVNYSHYAQEWRPRTPPPPPF